MGSDKAVSEIQDKISTLLGKKELTEFRPLLEILHQHAIATPPPYPPDVFNGLLELIQHMANDVKRGRSVNEILNDAISGSYIQPQWDVGSVVQAHGNIYQFILGKFRDEIEPSKPDPGFEVSVVLLVMTANEAKELIDGTAFQGYPQELQVDFKKLNDLLSTHGINDWQQRYKKTPEAWQPFSSDESASNIKQMMEKALCLIQNFQQPIIPNFVDIRDLNEKNNRSILNSLRFKGCIVVLDVISMRHPTIQSEFRRSLIDAFPSTLVAYVSPIYDVWEITQKMVVIVEQHVDMEFNKRYSYDRDTKCTRVTDFLEIERWVKEQTPKILPDEIKSQAGSREHWFQH